MKIETNYEKFQKNKEMKDCELLNINPEIEYQYVREQFKDIFKWLIKD